MKKHISEVNIERLLAKHSKSFEEYNIYEILGLKHSEIHHSRFIESLLNTKGMHKMGDSFLKLFLEIIMYSENISSFLVDQNFYTKRSPNNVKYTEIHTKSDDKSKKGYIDIYLKNLNGCSIIIENKIFAEDRESQLIKYRKFDKDAFLLYLTLDGKPPSFKSTKNQLSNYKCISYKQHILEWVSKCILKYKEDSKIIDDYFLLALKQYKRLIERITFNNKIKQEVYSYLKEWRRENNRDFPDALLLQQNKPFKIYCQIKDEFEQLPPNQKVYGSWSKISNKKWNDNQ